MKKKKLLSVFVLVLVVCFTWVSQVDAADITFTTVSDAELLFAGVSSEALGNNIFTYDVLKDDVKYTLCGLVSNSYRSNYTLSQLNTSKVVGDRVTFTLYILSFDGSFSTPSFQFRYTGYSALVNSEISYTISPVTLDLSSSNLTVTLSGYSVDISYQVSKAAYLDLYVNINSTHRCIVGLLCPYVSTGLSDEEKNILVQILAGVDNANAQLDDMQSEQSSYYEDILQSEASDTDVIAEASSKREQFDEIMNEYSSLNAELVRPGVDELLPDYSNVVNGFKDDKFYDSFDVFYDNSYIMFMLLSTVFFATLSYIIFGKKA